MRGEAVFASHLLYTQRGVLRDDIEEERKLGIDAGHAWIASADAMVVYMPRGGVVSPGMNVGIQRARAVGIPVEFRRLEPTGGT
jgi:ribosomal protein L27